MTRSIRIGQKQCCEMTMQTRDMNHLPAPGRFPRRFALVCLFIGLVLSPAASGEKGPYDWALIRLDYARQEKVAQLRSFCDRLHALALQAAQDPFVVACFDINFQYAEATAKGPVPEGLVERVTRLREGFNDYYIQNYFAFYDILFVDARGKVFHTIRKESDLHADLIQEPGEGNTLARCLRAAGQEEVFIDFHDYEPSSKPAAFFIEPVHRDGAHLGWIVLQCVISKVNTLLAWTDNLGQTGETFLINQHGYMLTESNFEGASTILKKRLDDRNVQAKFAERQGHRMVTDYRGCTALTSFEVVEFLGTQWLVVAKMDTDEIVTEHYMQHRRYYADKLLTCLTSAAPAPSQDPTPQSNRETLLVDMDEFLKADSGERVHTFGVSTCTAILAAYPGRFAYLAHISPRDKIYGADGTNLLGPMVKRIKGFDVYRCERHGVMFVVVMPHLNTLLAIVDKLVDEGFLLSQIKVVHDPRAGSATVSYDYPENDLVVRWRRVGPSDQSYEQSLEAAVNVGQIIQHVMRAEEEAGSIEPISSAILTPASGRERLEHVTATREEGGPDMSVIGDESV